MPRIGVYLLVILGAVLPGCRSSRSPLAKAKPAEPVVITQFYTTTAHVPRGERGLICYGTEGARTVWLNPPLHEYSGALARCVEVEPDATTTYTLTAEGRNGQSVSRDLTITVGAPRAKIIDVTVSALEVRKGELVNLCYNVQHAAWVRISPVDYEAASRSKGCTTDVPRQTTTYVVSAVGADGDRDEERVTVKVR